MGHPFVPDPIGCAQQLELRGAECVLPQERDRAADQSPRGGPDHGVENSKSLQKDHLLQEAPVDPGLNIYLPFVAQE